jgi:hypothetical protein
MGDRMSAMGRLVWVAGGLAGRVGKTGADPVVTGAGALAALLTAGTAVPVPGVGGRGVAATAAAVAEAARVAAAEAGVAAPAEGVAAGLALTADWDVPGAVGVAAPADEATGLVVAGPGGVVETAADAWPPEPAAG